MAPSAHRVSAVPARTTKEPGNQEEVRAALVSLEQMSTKRDRENLARFGITASKAFGVSMANMQVLAKRLGRNHELAAALWDTGSG
jgi:3-methyladenine DNA glycosylase AlkD